MNDISADRYGASRQKAIDNARSLLWENIQESDWWTPYSNFTENEAGAKKEQIVFDNWYPVFVELFTSFSGTLYVIEQDDVHNILQFGASRRLDSMLRAVNDICDIAYPNRTEIASKDEKNRLDDALLLFYVHLMGVFDALAIAFHRTTDNPDDGKERFVDLLNPKSRKKLDLQSLNTLFQENSDWFKRVKGELRHRYVHRVPPYVPPAEHDEKARAENEKLEQKLSSALLNRRFDELEGIRDEQALLGVFCSKISFIENNTYTPLLITVLDDAMRFQVIMLTVFNELVQRLKFVIDK